MASRPALAAFVVPEQAWIALVFCLALAGCNPEPSSVPPPWCEAEGSLDLSCDGDCSVAAIIVDYKRLEPRGYRLYSLDGGSAINVLEAPPIASAYVVEELKAPPPADYDCSRAEEFIHCVLTYPTRDQFLVVLHAVSGQVLFAGFEVWADPDQRGFDFPLPDGYRSGEALGCVDPIPLPSRKKLVSTGAPLGTAIASTSAEALDVVRRLNLAQQLTDGRDYHAFVIAHAPARGEFDPWSSDWYVWLHLLD